MRIPLGRVLLGCVLSIFTWQIALAAADPIVIYTAGPKPLSNALAKGFVAKTGIPVKLFQSTSGKVMARYMAEKSNPQADIIISASWGHALTLHDSGDLMAYTSPNAANIPAQFKASDYVSEGEAALAIAYNTDAGIKVPTQWSDLTDPSYKGQISMPDPAASGTALTLLEGLVENKGDEAWELIAGLKANDTIVPGANKAALSPVLSGSRSVVFGAVDYVVLGARAKGEHVNVAYPKDGTVLAPRPIMILKTAQHPQEAKQFVDYVLSIEGQKLVADYFLLPARTDVAARRPGYNELKLIDFDLAHAADKAAATKDHFAQIMKP